MARLPSKAVERRIVFYRADGGLDDHGIPHPVDLSPALRHIGTLPFTNHGRYVVVENDLVTCCWVDRVGHNSRVRIANIRRSELPQVEEVGNLQPLGITSAQGIAEQVHTVMFQEAVSGIATTIAGAVFNFYGPRLPRLGHYINVRGNDLTPRITFRPLLRRDAAEALDRLKDIRLFRLRVDRSYVESLESESDSLGTAFQAARDLGHADDIEVVLRPRRYSRQPISEGILELARRLVQRPDTQEGVIAFEVRGLNGQTGNIDLVDVLNDKLVAQKRILRESLRSRALDDDSAYSAIEEAYQELRDELIRSASIWAPP